MSQRDEWREVLAEDALRELRLHPDDEWEFSSSLGWIAWVRGTVLAGRMYRHRPRAKTLSHG